MPKKSSNVATEKVSKIIKKLPVSESGHGVHCTTSSGEEYQISQNPDKKKHTLWKIVDGGYQKIATANSPYDLYPIIGFK